MRKLIKEYWGDALQILILPALGCIGAAVTGVNPILCLILWGMWSTIIITFKLLLSLHKHILLMEELWLGIKELDDIERKRYYNNEKGNN